MQADSVSRRDLFKNIAAFGLAAAPLAANALVEYENVPFLGGSDVIDINNANVRVYTRLPGMYPNIAKQIVKNVPFKSVEDLYKLKTLSSEQKETIRKYEKNLVALEPAPEVLFIIAKIRV
jgi:photosystem II PsbU protein